METPPSNLPKKIIALSVVADCVEALKSVKMYVLIEAKVENIVNL